MKHLSRAEELILLAVFRLKRNAYCVHIFDQIQSISKQKLILTVAGAGMAAVLIAVTSIAFQSLKAAFANPVDSLRNE